MPVTPPTMAGAIAPNLAASGSIGLSAPQLALGVGIGVATWTQQIVVSTVDTGTLGSGSGVPTPILIPPSLIGNMLSGFASFGMTGILSPALATALANGIMLGYLQGLLVTSHPTVGVGAGVAKFSAPAAGPSIIAGLGSAGMSGQQVPKIGGAIGMGLDLSFASLVMPVAIVGAPSPSSGGGVGVGKIV